MRITPPTVAPARAPSAAPATPAAPSQTPARRIQDVGQFASAQGPTPAAEGGADKAYDGFLVGGDGRAYPPGTRPQDIPAVKPNNGKTPTGTVIFVNGVGESRSRFTQSHLQEIANGTGQNVVGLYNGTEGQAKDIFNIGKNKAADSMADMVYQQLKAGQPVRIMAHSQGALITSRALEAVRNRLMLEDGMSKGEAQRRLGQVTVETFGGAAPNWVDGPKYTHYVNKSDIVPTWLGVGRPFLTHPGKDAVIKKFEDGNDAHNTSTYFKHYQA
jgi:hypothetical protein